MPEDIFQTLNTYTGVSRETFEKLSTYHDLLLRWQAKINLVGPDTLNDAWHRHFLDSLQLLNHLPNNFGKIIDIGSGAGYPGMALAVAGIVDIHLIESDAKKIAFLKEVARVTDTKVFIHHSRIEDVSIPNVSIILSRACSNLDNLLSFSLPFVSHETISLLHKGKNYSTDVEDANEHWLFEHTVIPSITDTQGVILKITNIRRKMGV